MPSYRGYRFPPEIISYAVWLYHRFGLLYARKLRQRRGRQGDTWHLDELFVTIQRAPTLCYGRGIDMLNGAYHYLDTVPKGRDEADLPWTQAWVRRHDEYDNH